MVAEDSIEIKGLSFFYPNADKPALEDINMHIPAGQMTKGVRGMFGIVGLLFQDFETQLFSTRVELELAFCMENRGMQRPVMQEEVKRLLAVVGLEGFEQYAPTGLSGGQKQRLAIGSVLAGAPRLLILDEPTTDLDPVGKTGIFTLLRALRKETQRAPGAGPDTVVIIEHETEEAVHADRIIIMEQGRIVADGTPEQVLPAVPLFEQVGLMPLPFCAYFRRLGFPQNALPLTLDEAEHLFQRSDLSLDESCIRELAARDGKRSLAYGKEIIRTAGLLQSFGKREILKGLDLSVREREFVAVLGANGSGKTTFVKHLNGLLRPKDGRVYLAGSDAADLSIFEMGQVVGYVFQNPDQQIFCDTVFEEVAYGLKLRGISDTETAERVREALEAVGLPGCEEEDPFSLSKGQRQRVAVASVLAIKPEVLILDEPTTGLDYKDQRRMMELVKSLNEAGHTIVMITHTMWVVAEYAHRVVLLRDGRIVADGCIRDIFADEATLAQAEVCPPQITRLGNRLGGTALSVAELLYCTRMPEVQP